MHAACSLQAIQARRETRAPYRCGWTQSAARTVALVVFLLALVLVNEKSWGGGPAAAAAGSRNGQDQPVLHHHSVCESAR